MKVPALVIPMLCLVNAIAGIKPVVIAVDNGYKSNFVRSNLVERLKIAISISESAGGDKNMSVMNYKALKKLIEDSWKANEIQAEAYPAGTPNSYLISNLHCMFRVPIDCIVFDNRKVFPYLPSLAPAGPDQRAMSFSKNKGVDVGSKMIEYWDKMTTSITIPLHPTEWIRETGVKSQSRLFASSQDNIFIASKYIEILNSRFKNFTDYQYYKVQDSTIHPVIVHYDNQPVAIFQPLYSAKVKYPNPHVHNGEILQV